MSTAIDLSQLTPPDVIETISFEEILNTWRTQFLDSLPADDRADFAETIMLESEPIAKLLELAAYHELLLRQRINDASRGTMLAYAGGNDLDHWGAGRNMLRFTGESDYDYRRRLQLSLEGITTAGSIGSYVFHALNADPDVKDVSITSPSDGVVLVTVLARSGDGEATPGLIDAVELSLNSESVRPVTDHVQVESASIIEFSVDATLHVRSGPDTALIGAAATEAAQQYVDDRRKLGSIVSLSGLYAALQRPGVEYVELTSPADDVVTTNLEATFCTGLVISTEVYT